MKKLFFLAALLLPSLSHSSVKTDFVSVSSGSITYTIGYATASGDGTIQYSIGNHHANFCTQSVHIIPYRVIGSSRVYSTSNPSTDDYSFAYDNGLGLAYRIGWSWPTVATASGYRLIKFDDCAGYNEDYYADTATNSFDDYGPEVWSAGNTVTPTSLTVKGTAIRVGQGTVDLGPDLVTASSISGSTLSYSSGTITALYGSTAVFSSVTVNTSATINGVTYNWPTETDTTGLCLGGSGTNPVTLSWVSCTGEPAVPAVPYFALLESDSTFILLEDGVAKLQLEK